MSDQKSIDNKKIAKLRREYNTRTLSVEEVESDPLDQFAIWFQQALDTEARDPNAMTLSTVSNENKPSSRIVLLKGFDESGFQFFTNYRSRKGIELAQNINAALCFYWPVLERQIRIEGEVERVSREESENYFRQRPRKSQLGALVSNQSQPVDSRQKLEQRFKELEKRFAGKEVPVPEFWGGYKLEPHTVEFWQGREGRLHDRVCYKKENGKWTISRLAP